MKIQRFSHHIRRRNNCHSFNNYSDRSMLWISDRYLTVRIRNGGYLLLSGDIDRDQLSLLSGVGNCIENLEPDLTDFIYGTSVFGTTSFYDEQTGKLENENGIL